MAASTFTPSPRLVYKDSWTREPLALSSALLLRLLVPAYHLLHLTGPFPVIHGNDDKRIPKKTDRRTTLMIPELKTVPIQPGPHIDGNRPQLILQTIVAARNWLTKQNLLEK
jgi:hypothetical protein